MKSNLINQLVAEIWAEIALNVSSRCPNLASNSVWAQQRPGQMLKKNGIKLTQLGDTIEAGRQAVRWFRSCHQRMLADRKEQLDRYLSPGAVVRHGNVRDTG